MLNINLWNFTLQCAAMGAWVFLVAAIYAIIEKILDKYVPGFLEVEPMGASQAPGQVINTPTINPPVNTTPTRQQA
ncbi:MAG: hypothetical protein IT536_04310 [Hyphomicrobiales bacterium]|nr:hypothetical protein [Hyphomicrobiales bacterium]